MQYPFTEEQLALADLTREFMERDVAPVAAEMDRRPDPKDCYPGELLNKASQLGLRTMAVPEEHGGIGADTTTKALCLWTGAQIEIGVIKCLSQCWKISNAIFKCGTEAQIEKWGKMFVEDHDCVGSFVITEPDYGSDNIYRQSDPALGLKTSAVEDGDYYIINGAKRFTSLTSWAQILLVFARTDPTVPLHQGTSCFLVHGDQEGVSYGNVHDKLGYRLYPNAESYYDNVRVHKDDILGGREQGFLHLRHGVPGQRRASGVQYGHCARHLQFLPPARERTHPGRQTHHRAPDDSAPTRRDADEHRGGRAVHVAHLLGRGER